MQSVFLDRFRGEIKSHVGEIESALALGATPDVASLPYLRAAYKASLIPSIDNVRSLGIVWIPGIMAGMVLSGASPIYAALYQFVVISTIFSAAAVTCLTASYLITRARLHRQPAVICPRINPSLSIPPPGRISLASAMSSPQQSESLPTTAPVARREPKTTTIHGHTLVDDYAWLRDKSSPEVIAYLEAENSYSTSIMQSTDALQQTLYDEMVSHIKETDESVPFPDRDYFYYSRTEQGRQYPIYCRKVRKLAEKR